MMSVAGIGQLSYVYVPFPYIAPIYVPFQDNAKRKKKCIILFYTKREK